MLRSMTTYISEILKDDEDAFSSKRFVVIAAALSIKVAFFANLFFGKTVEEFMFEGLMFIVIAGLGFVGAEKFRRNTSKE
jgi:FtsH-binding integral membrane protein